MSLRNKILYAAFNAAFAFAYANYIEHGFVKRNLQYFSSVERYEQFRHEHFDRGLFLPMEMITAPARNMAYDAFRQ